MASTKKKKKKKEKPLFRMDDRGKTADGKNKLYFGYVGDVEIGYVCASTATDGKKKLLRIARAKLK